ncbi:MAG: TonB-dependent receptor plug domain-containing protein, partial [Chitinophagales bacterium]
FELEESSEKLEEVEVVGERSSTKNIESVEMSVTDLSIATIKQIPAVFGEVDIVKSIQLLPGITNAGEGVGGFFVRGGSVDQNLILLDEATVYNPSHLLGFFSVFNPDAIKDVKLYKGGIPAEYGGRLSSLMDIRMNEGNMKKWSVSGGIGLISSKLTVEGPLKKDKASFIVSGRRTYADLFLKLSRDEALRDNQLYFYDLSAKVNYKINDKNRVFLSGYFGQDRFILGNAFSTGWGNSTATMRWNHLFSPKLFSNFTFIYSKFNYSLGIPQGAFAFDWDASIRDFSVKSDFTAYVTPNSTLKFGFQAIHHTFEPANFQPSGAEDESFLKAFKVPNKHAIEPAAYFSSEHKIGSHVVLQYGLRYSAFYNIGPGQVFEYEEDGETVKDTTFYDSFEGIKFYHGLEPRVSANFIINADNSIKTSYNRTRQYLHLISNSTVSSPFDIWVPSDPFIKPQIADQVALGYFRNFFGGGLETSIEVYYKKMQNLIDYKDNAELLLNDKLETQLLSGDGRSYGAEFFIKKPNGRITGWISYTLARTEREIPGINDGKVYPATQDRRHNLSVVSSFNINEKWSVSANWVYYTGLAVTFPVGRFTYDGVVAPIFSERNGYRLPDYHRLDLAVNFSWQKRKRWSNQINLSFYNLYNRKNPFSYTFRQSGENDTKAVKTYLFGIVPSFTYSFKLL